MNFENSFSTNTETDKNKEEELNLEQELKEKEQALFNFCKQHGNPIVFLESGKVVDKNLSLSRSLQNLTDNDKELAEIILDRANEFLGSPLFSDSFHQDHGSRRIWEDQHVEQKLSSEMLEHYSSNRFNLNRLSLPFSFKMWLESLNENDIENFKSSAIFSELRSDLNQISPEDLRDYGRSSDEEKRIIIKRFEKIFRNIVTLLTEA